MPKETPTALPSAAPATDLPARTELDNLPTPLSGSIKDMLSLSRLGQADPPPDNQPPPTDAPAPVSATPAPAATPPEPSKEERIAKAEEALRKRLGFKTKAKPADSPAPQDAPQPASPPSDGDPKPPAPAKQAKRAIVKDPAQEYAERLERLEQQRIDIERERLALERQRGAQTPPPQQSSEPAALGLMSDDERYEYEVFGQMDKAEAGKDYQKKFIKAIESAAAYKAEWEKKNPDETFDPNDSAHDAFYAKNSVRYDKLAFRRAEVKLAHPDQPKEDPQARAELRQLKLQNALRDLQPRALKTAAEQIASVLKAVDPDIEKTVREGGRDELMKQYPARGPKVIESASAIQTITNEAFSLLETDGLIEPDANNPVHRMILDIIIKQEPMITSQPRNEQLDAAGRPFATWEQWAAMSPAQRQQHWHLGAEEVADIFSQAQGQRLKAELDAIKQEAGPRQAAPSAPRQPAPVPVVSPTLSSRSVIDTSGKHQAVDQNGLDKKLRGILFQRPS